MFKTKIRVLPGPKGDKGDPGVPGPMGATGKSGNREWFIIILISQIWTLVLLGFILFLIVGR